MTKIKQALIVLAASLGLLTLFVHQPAFAINCDQPATSKEAIQCGSCDAAGASDCTVSQEQAASNINDTIGKIINILSVVVGIVAVIMIVVAGFRYITSAGNDQAIAGAKKTLIYALIGLIIVATSQVIARFVLKQTTNSVNSPSACVPGPGVTCGPK